MKSVARRPTIRSLVVLALGLVMGCATSGAAGSPTSAALRGMVYNASRMPVLDMKVSLVRDGKPVAFATTDIHGRYFIPDVPYGPVILQFTKEGYEPLDWSFTFEKPTQVVYVQVINLNELLDKMADAIQKRDWTGATSLLGRIRKMEPDNEVAAYLEAEMVSRQGDPERAAALLENLSESKDSCLAVELALADLYEKKLDQPDKALFHLKKAAMIQDDVDIKRRIEEMEGR